MAKGSYQRDFSGLGTSNLVAGKSWVVETQSGYEANSANSITGPYGTRINVTQVNHDPSWSEPNYGGVIVKMSSTAINLTRGAEYTLVFDAQAADTTTYGGTTYEGTPGFIRIRNPRLYTGTADRFKREFDNGIVYLNESYVSPWTVDAGSSYKKLTVDIRPDIHDGSLVNGNVTVPSQDAVYLLKR